MIDTKTRRSAYCAVLDVKGQARLAIAVEGTEGYYPVKEDSDAGGTFASYDEAADCADRYNERMGLSKMESAKVVLSTMGESRRGRGRK